MLRTKGDLDRHVQAVQQFYSIQEVKIYFHLSVLYSNNKIISFFE